MIKVIARRGVRVPTEDDARRYITDADAIDVESTPYILRRLRDGDLQMAPATSEAQSTGDSDIPVVEAAKASRTAKEETDNV